MTGNRFLNCYDHQKKGCKNDFTVPLAAKLPVLVLQVHPAQPRCCQEAEDLIWKTMMGGGFAVVQQSMEVIALSRRRDTGEPATLSKRL